MHFYIKKARKQQQKNPFYVNKAAHESQGPKSKKPPLSTSGTIYMAPVQAFPYRPPETSALICKIIFSKEERLFSLGDSSGPAFLLIRGPYMSPAEV